MMSNCLLIYASKCGSKMSKSWKKVNNQSKSLLRSKVSQIYAILCKPFDGIKGFLHAGRGGCGKSFFLGCLDRYQRHVFPNNPNFLKIAAPTGTAAFNVNGSTLHSLLQLPVPINPKVDVKDLHGDQLIRLQREFKGTHLLAIDEKSMGED